MPTVPAASESVSSDSGGGAMVMVYCRDCCCELLSATRAVKVNEPAVNRLILPASYAIMELKADERVPEWAISMLARHDCQLNRVSKYCAGVAQIRNIPLGARARSPGVPLPLEPGEGDAAEADIPGKGGATPPISEP